MEREKINGRKEGKRMLVEGEEKGWEKECLGRLVDGVLGQCILWHD